MDEKIISSIDHSKKVLADLGDMVSKIAQLVKHFSVLKAMSELKAMESDMKDLFAQAPLALPELKDLDAQSAVQLAEAAYVMVQEVLASIAV